LITASTTPNPSFSAMNAARCKNQKGNKTEDEVLIIGVMEL
jgi:hypothetical protein